LRFRSFAVDIESMLEIKTMSYERTVLVGILTREQPEDKLKEFHVEDVRLIKGMCARGVFQKGMGN